MKKVLTLITIFLLFLLTACPLPGSDEYEMIENIEKLHSLYPADIINFPSWYGNYHTGINSYSVSDWQSWNNERAVNLKKIIGTEIKDENFNGNYQIIVKGMKFYILFDDEITERQIFYNYIPVGDLWEKTWGFIFITQNNSDEYSYSAFIRMSDFDLSEGSNLIKLIQNYDYKAEFNYLLNISGLDVINEKFTTYKPYSVEVYIPDWLRYKSFSMYKSTVYGQKFYGFDFEEDSKGFPYLSYIMQLESETEDSVTYSFDGISQNQPKYLKIENLGDAEFLFSWYKDLNSEPVESFKQNGWAGF